MKYLIFAILAVSASAFADDCSNKALRGVQALAKINHYRILDLKVTGMKMTQGDGTQLLLSARDRHDHPYSFTADVGQAEGPCILLGVAVTQSPWP